MTPEQYEAASTALRDRLRKQELARQTRAARRDPVIAALLDDAFARLGLLDPERHVRDAIACYPRDAIVDAIAIFSGKRTAVLRSLRRLSSLRSTTHVRGQSAR